MVREQLKDKSFNKDDKSIVLCKDCKYFETDVFNQKVCIRTYNHFIMKPLDFCSYGTK